MTEHKKPETMKERELDDVAGGNIFLGDFMGSRTERGTAPDSPAG